MGLMMVVVVVVIPTASLLPKVRGVQPYCTDIQGSSSFYLTLMLSRAHHQTHQLTRLSLRSSMMRLMVVMASRSKNCQKVEKPQRPEKSAKAISLEEPNFLISDTRLAFTKMRSSHTKLTMKNYLPLLKALKNWRHSLPTSSTKFLSLLIISPTALFAGLSTSLDTIFKLITNKTKQVGLLMLCCVFPQRSQEDLWAENIRVFQQL